MKKLNITLLTPVLFIICIIYNPYAFALTDDDFEKAKRSIDLVLISCLSSSKVSYKIKGSIDVSIIKKIALGGQAAGQGEYEHVDIVSYLPELQDDLQQKERDEIRACANPTIREILIQHKIIPKPVIDILCIDESREFSTNFLGVRESVTFTCTAGNVIRQNLRLKVKKNGDLGLGNGSARIEKIEGKQITVYHWMDAGTTLKYHLQAWAEQ